MATHTQCTRPKLSSEMSSDRVDRQPWDALGPCFMVAADPRRSYLNGDARETNSGRRRRMSPKPRRSLERGVSAAPIYQLKVTLADVRPPAWRRITVRGDLSLERLHAVFQTAMGWQDAHLHKWIVGGRAL